MPLERFEAPLEMKCAHDTICAKTVRSKHVLGGSTGIVLVGGNEGEASLAFTQAGSRRLELRGDGESVHSLTLNWDGDAYPQQLSGAGLGCFNLLAQQADAFIMRDMRLAYSCGAPGKGGACPPIEIETRIYDADDATGQRFSASVIKRRGTEANEEVVVPFSNLVREGPRGLARPTCVGAISITFRFEGQRDVRLALGPIYTNGADGLTFVPTATPTATSTATPSATPTATATEAAAPALQGEGGAQTAVAAVAASPLPAALGSPAPAVTPLPTVPLPGFGTPARLEVFDDEELERVSLPKVPQLEEGTRPTPSSFVTEREGDVVYGSVASGAP